MQCRKRFHSDRAAQKIKKQVEHTMVISVSDAFASTPLLQLANTTYVFVQSWITLSAMFTSANCPPHKSNQRSSIETPQTLQIMFPLNRIDQGDNFNDQHFVHGSHICYFSKEKIVIHPTLVQSYKDLISTSCCPQNLLAICCFATLHMCIMFEKSNKI